MKKKSTSIILLTAGISCLSALFSNAELVDGLVEHWAFDDDYTAALDVSNDGVLAVTGTGSATFVTGKFGSAVDLENSVGNQAVINVGDPAEFAFEGASMSISAWYTTQSLYTNWQTLVSQAEGGNWRIARHGSSDTNFKYSVGGPGNVAANIDLQDESWHHVAVTHESGGDITMYVDGVAAATQAEWVLGNGGGLIMQIGGNAQAAERGWDGNIDDVAIWDRPLTPEEVSLIWNDGAGASIASLTGGTPTLFQIVDVAHTRTADNILVDLTFTSKEGSSYSVFATNDLSLPFASWGELNDGFPAAVGATTTNFPVNFNDLGLPLDDLQFFVVVKN
ncbi:MAG: hypothetical protein ACJAQT_000619 [Akkermansiaceae bacterium]|jgi:hypothetical protein